MKKIILICITIQIANNCLSKGINKTTILKDIIYFSVSPKNEKAELRLTGDSLELKFKGISEARAEHYEVEKQEKKGQDYLIFVKRMARPQQGKILKVRPLPPYGLVVLRFSGDSKNLYAFQEHRWFQTLQEVETTANNSSYQNKYFFTWYPESDFKKYCKLPDAKNANKQTIQKVAYYLASELNGNFDKREQTVLMDPYGSGVFTDKLSIALIKNNLSPMTSSKDFIAKMVAEKVIMPKIKHVNNGNNMPLSPDTVGLKSPGIGG